MTDEERARVIYTGYCLAARARSKSYVPWEKLPEVKRDRLVATAKRLRLEYAASPDPISRGGFR